MLSEGVVRSTEHEGGWALHCSYANGGSGFLTVTSTRFLDGDMTHYPIVWPSRDEAEDERLRRLAPKTTRTRRDGSTESLTEKQRRRMQVVECSVLPVERGFGVPVKARGARG